MSFKLDLERNFHPSIVDFFCPSLVFVFTCDIFSPWLQVPSFFSFLYFGHFLNQVMLWTSSSFFFLLFIICFSVLVDLCMDLSIFPCLFTYFWSNGIICVCGAFHAFFDRGYSECGLLENRQSKIVCKLLQPDFSSSNIKTQNYFHHCFSVAFYPWMHLCSYLFVTNLYFACSSFFNSSFPLSLFFALHSHLPACLIRLLALWFHLHRFHTYIHTNILQALFRLTIH